MIKKLLISMAPVAAVAAVAMAPSASGDTFYRCPKGVTNHKYCTKIVQCVVPQLRGKTVAQAGSLLAAHDCKLGKVNKAAGSGVPKGRILRSTPAAGTRHQKGMKVNVIVRK